MFEFENAPIVPGAPLLCCEQVATNKSGKTFCFVLNSLETRIYSNIFNGMSVFIVLHVRCRD